MGLHYEDLDVRTRSFMASELASDVEKGTTYVSPRLTTLGLAEWPSLLREAVQMHDDDWLANQVGRTGLLKSFEQRKTKSGYTEVAVPYTAAATLAEGEFNRLFVRGLCLRAIEDGITEVQVYRGKAVENARSASIALIGKMFPCSDVLDRARTSINVDSAFNIPAGPNSGITVRLPRA